MPSLRRDTLLAGGLLAVLVAACLWAVGPDPLVTPSAAALGVGGAVAVEAAFLQFPGTLLAVWECPGVAVAGTAAVGLLAAGSLLVAPWLLGAAAWGLVTYLLLAGCVLVGVGNPLAALVGPPEGE